MDRQTQVEAKDLVQGKKGVIPVDKLDVCGPGIRFRCLVGIALVLFDR